MSTRPCRPELIERAISAAIAFLFSRQVSYGEFRTYAWGDEPGEERPIFDSSPFVTSLVLYSLGFCHDDRVVAMTRKGLDFLCSEVEGPGLWRYWSSKNERHELLPPDLDDTCNVSFILSRHGRAFPPNRHLILANRNGQGLFYTWMSPRGDSTRELTDAIEPFVNPIMTSAFKIIGALDNIDCAVNANVLLYLGECRETQAAADYLVDKVLEDNDLNGSSYYLDPLSVYYMLSRARANGAYSLNQTSDPVTNRIVARQSSDGSWGNPLLTALAACTLLNYARPLALIDGAVDYLLRVQRGDGAWAQAAMFAGRSPFYGSEELTTAFCVEALARYIQA